MVKLSKVDFAVGGAVATAGLMATRRRPVAGALLFAAGVTAVAVADAALRARLSGTAASATYDPVDTLKPLADGIWTVDSGPMHGFLPVRMTVIRLADGGLLLHSPTRATPSLRAAMDRTGPVRALLSPNLAHWSYVAEWQRCYPAAKTWAAPGVRRRKAVVEAGLRIDYTLGGAAPPEWAGVLDVIQVPGGLGFTEVALFHRPSRTLVLTDLVQNFEPERLPAIVRPLARLAGNTAPDGRAPAHLRAIMGLGGRRAREAAQRLVQLRPERVVFAHGATFGRDAPDRLARSLGWLLPKQV